MAIVKIKVKCAECGKEFSVNEKKLSNYLIAGECTEYKCKGKIIKL